MSQDIDLTKHPSWGYWARMLQSGPNSKMEDLHDGDVHWGYYRRSFAKKGANARWVAIGIYPRQNEIVVEVDGKPDNRRPFDLLFSKSLQAITYERYVAVTRHGEPWPDAVPASDRIVQRGDNLPDDVDPLTAHQQQLVEEKILVGRLLETRVTTQEQADRASEFCNRVAALSKWFKDEYEKQNRPLLDQQKKLREDYLHPSQEASRLAQQLTEHQTGYLVARQRQLDQERLQREAEAEEAQIQLPVEEPSRAASGGLTGRRTSLRNVKEARVVDYMAFATYLVTYGLTTQPEECRNPDLKFALDKLATKFIHHKDVAEIPGIVITEEQVARR